MLRNPSQSMTRFQQRGAVLFVALVFLVLITLLGLTAASTSILQERMTGGLRNGQLALMGAESAVRNVEWILWNKANDSTSGTSNKLSCDYSGGLDHCYQPSTNTGVMQMEPLVAAFRLQKGWPASTSGDDANAYATTMTGLSGTQVGASLAQQPRYIIEDLGIALPPGVPISGCGDWRCDPGATKCGQVVLHDYRITARATGGNNGSVRAVESHFIVQPPCNS